MTFLWARLVLRVAVSELPGEWSVLSELREWPQLQPDFNLDQPLKCDRLHRPGISVRGTPCFQLTSHIKSVATQMSATHQMRLF